MRTDGGCHCGFIKYEGEAYPEKAAVCHCTDCQTLSGSAYRTVVPTDNLRRRLARYFFSVSAPICSVLAAALLDSPDRMQTSASRSRGGRLATMRDTSGERVGSIKLLPSYCFFFWAQLIPCIHAVSAGNSCRRTDCGQSQCASASLQQLGPMFRTMMRALPISAWIFEGEKHRLPANVEGTVRLLIPAVCLLPRRRRCRYPVRGGLRNFPANR